MLWKLCSIVTHRARCSSVNRSTNISRTFLSCSSFVWRSLICCCWSSNSFSNSRTWLRGSSAEIKKLLVLTFPFSNELSNATSPHLMIGKGNLRPFLPLSKYIEPTYTWISYRPLHFHVSEYFETRGINDTRCSYKWPAIIFSPLDVRKEMAVATLLSMVHKLFHVSQTRLFTDPISLIKLSSPPSMKKTNIPWLFPDQETIVTKK